MVPLPRAAVRWRFPHRAGVGIALFGAATPAMIEGDMGSGSTTGEVANLQWMWALGLTPVPARRGIHPLFPRRRDHG